MQDGYNNNPSGQQQPAHNTTTTETHEDIVEQGIVIKKRARTEVSQVDGPQTKVYKQEQQMSYTERYNAPMNVNSNVYYQDNRRAAEDLRRELRSGQSGEQGRSSDRQQYPPPSSTSTSSYEREAPRNYERERERDNRDGFDRMRQRESYPQRMEQQPQQQQQYQPQQYQPQPQQQQQFQRTYSNDRRRFNPPDRWIEYPGFGGIVDGTNLVPIKTPLSRNFFVPERERFAPEDLVDSFSRLGYNIGLVIDLTNTNRYYDPNDFLKQRVEYKKLECEGQMVPDEKTVKIFQNTIIEFNQKTKNPRSLIAVHCTHGVNRTGYLIVRYLQDCLNIPFPRALRLFETARSKRLEKPSYLEVLIQHQRSLDEQIPGNPFKAENEEIYARILQAAKDLSLPPSYDYRRFYGDDYQNYYDYTLLEKFKNFLENKNEGEDEGNIEKFKEEERKEPNIENQTENGNENQSTEIGTQKKEAEENENPVSIENETTTNVTSESIINEIPNTTPQE